MNETPSETRPPEPPTDYAMALDSLRDMVEQNAALRAENERLREVLSVCGDVAAAMLLPSIYDTDWRAFKRDIDTALGNAQDARDGTSAE